MIMLGAHKHLQGLGQLPLVRYRLVHGTGVIIVYQAALKHKIGKFISECLEKSDENLAAKDVYEKYSQWCNDCGLGVDGRTSFYEELKTKNLLSKTGTVTGKTVKNVIKGYSFAEETFHSVDRGLDAPFS